MSTFFGSVFYCLYNNSTKSSLLPKKNFRTYKKHGKSFFVGRRGESNFLNIVVISCHVRFSYKRPMNDIDIMSLKKSNGMSNIFSSEK